METNGIEKAYSERREETAVCTFLHTRSVLIQHPSVDTLLRLFDHNDSKSAVTRENWMEQHFQYCNFISAGEVLD